MATKSSSPIVVKRSKIQGRGVFAARNIRPEERLIEYVGELISHKEADSRYDDEAMERHHTMLFSLDSKHCIDAAVGGNAARFINHSCAPNCEARQEGRRIYIFSIAPITKGAELVYDYRYTGDPSLTLAEAKKTYPCYCGTKGCRGTIIELPKKKKPKKRAVAKTGSSPRKSGAPSKKTRVASKRGSTKSVPKKKSLKPAR